MKSLILMSGCWVKLTGLPAAGGHLAEGWCSRVQTRDHHQLRQWLPAPHPHVRALRHGRLHHPAQEHGGPGDLQRGDQSHG